VTVINPWLADLLRGRVLAPCVKATEQTSISLNAAQLSRGESRDPTDRAAGSPRPTLEVNSSMARRRDARRSLTDRARIPSIVKLGLAEQQTGLRRHIVRVSIVSIVSERRWHRQALSSWRVSAR
jgi:hypothetical protein